MHNLGAYRVDRRLKHGLYKDVLKAYSCVLLERGYHSLFFPGGTRSRSGGVERKLKLGLAGTGVEALARTAARGQMRKVFFVPATINYLLTLEAETLIDDFLQEEGKHRYIIEDDESTRPGRIAAFMRKLLGLDAGCVVRFCQPLDCFGNRVDEEGVSHDARGHAVSPLSYLTDGEGRVVPRPVARRAVHARARRGHRRRVLARHGGDRDAPRGGVRVREAARVGGGIGGRPPRARARPRRTSSRCCGSKDDVTVSRAELAESVERLRDRARELEARGRIVLGAAASRGRAGARSSTRRSARSAATTRRPCSSRAARTSSSPTRASSSITRTASRARGSPPISSRPVALAGRPRHAEAAPAFGSERSAAS